MTATHKFIKQVDRFAIYIARNWVRLFVMVYGMWVLLPFTAPVLMQLGLELPANVVYFIYSFFCHQLPERSFFFFGPKLMYGLDEIGKVWSTANPTVLRQFVGTAEMGWKMAWSDRMISVYGGVWLAGLLYLAWGKRKPRVSLWAWALFGVVPLGIDGVTHMINDVVAGTSGAGFRDTNEWLRAIIGGLPDSFYSGNQLGSFNSWARWLTGFVFSFTTVFALFPILDTSMQETAEDAAYQLARIQSYEREA
jgi:uncharacterized membrane protein